MENLLIYFLKVNGLIVLFYLMYVLFLRKETFFTSNRWYLISGLVLSLLLPLVTFTKTIWIEPGKVFCALFWANPIIWLYRKAILQNLEFIADNETFQQIENKYLYQRTLLKVVTHQHNLSITNQFYQSLIKKRIVMLHTNQSNKKNVWKYATILPLLVGFMLLFQIETIAQVKEVTSENQQNEKVIFEKKILKTASDEEIKKIISELDAFLSINTSIKRIDRTKSKELKTLIFEYIDKKGHEGEFGISGINEDFPDESFLYAEKSNDTILKIGLFNSKWLEFAKKENNSIGKNYQNNLEQK